jgi:ABC-2 type transport system permease protein
MKMLLAILVKELLQMSRNSMLLFLLFVCPLILLGVIPYSMENDTRIRAGIADHDASASSRHLAAMMVHAPDYISVENFSTMEQAEASVRKGDTDLIVMIPKYYERQMQQHDPLPLKIAVDATHPQRAQNIMYNTIRLLQGGNESIRAHRLFGTGNSQQPYYLISLLTLVHAIIAVSLMALSIVEEKERGVLDQFKATSLKRRTYISGKYMVLTMACLAVSALGLLFCRLAYGFTIAGSTWHYLLLTAMFSFPLLSLGYFIAVLSKNQVQAVYLVIFALLTMILMSTMFTHLSSMPWWAQQMRFVNPVYFMLDASRMVILKGVELKELGWQIMMMTGTGILLAGTAAVIMNRSPERW